MILVEPLHMASVPMTNHLFLLEAPQIQENRVDWGKQSRFVTSCHTRMTIIGITFLEVFVMHS